MEGRLDVRGQEVREAERELTAARMGAGAAAVDAEVSAAGTRPLRIALSSHMAGAPPSGQPPEGGQGAG
eukprot:2802056-Prymnesium_polylepis.1